MAATEDTHCYCPPILFIPGSNEWTVEEDDQIYGPFYLVSWGDIANIYTGDSLEYVVALSLKGAKVVSFKRMQEAVRASFAFCGENHPHSTHLESDCRRHLTDVMENLPILTRPNSPPEWEADGSENPLPTTTSTPTSADLFPSPSSPVGSPRGLNTPKSDTFSEVLSSDTNSNDFDDGVQDTGVLTIDDTDLEAMTHEPTLEPERDNTMTADSLASPGNTGRNVAGACPRPGHYGAFYLVRLEHDRSFLFSTREAAEHTLEQIRAEEDGDLIVTHGVVNCPDALLRDRTVKRFYYGVRGLDNHGVFCDARLAQALFQREIVRHELTTIMISSNEEMAARWALGQSAKIETCS